MNGLALSKEVKSSYVSSVIRDKKLAESINVLTEALAKTANAINKVNSEVNKLPTYIEEGFKKVISQMNKQDSSTATFASKMKEQLNHLNKQTLILNKSVEGLKTQAKMQKEDFDSFNENLNKAFVEDKKLTDIKIEDQRREIEEWRQKAEDKEKKTVKETEDLTTRLDNIEAGKLNAQIKAVMSNNSKAGALERARNHNIPAIHLSHKQFATPEEFDQKLLSVLKENETDLVILAGYMKMLSPTVVRAYKNKILNIHPALLPSFGGKGMYGIHVHEAVIAAGVKVTGVTVHLVDEIYDHGAIIVQKCVPVSSDDTPETLQQRVLPHEHELYSKAIQLFAEGKVEIKDNKAFIKS